MVRVNCFDSGKDTCTELSTYSYSLEYIHVYFIYAEEIKNYFLELQFSKWIDRVGCVSEELAINRIYYKIEREKATQIRWYQNQDVNVLIEVLWIC